VKPPKARLPEILERLEQRYPDAKCSLDFTNAFELLIATILSAQSTDVRVNIVTKSLFRKYPGPREFANADLVAMETDVKQTGFFRNKAKAVINCAKVIMEKHGGEVPRTMDELTALPGVGRKTANVVLSNAFETPVGIVVDTHMARVSGRLGFTSEADPEKIEADLMKLVPRDRWTRFGHLVIIHGRETCIARKPKCEECVVNALCPSAEVAPVRKAPAKATAQATAKATAKAGPASRPASTGRSARSATPSSPRPRRSRPS
jgi:endonuclease-3